MWSRGLHYSTTERKNTTMKQTKLWRNLLMNPTTKATWKKSSKHKNYLPTIGIINWYNGCALAMARIEFKSSTKQLVSGIKYFGRTSMCNATVLWLSISYWREKEIHLKFKEYFLIIFKSKSINYILFFFTYISASNFSSWALS